MDDALIEVEALMKRIEKFESNFKKCSKANRTKGYLTGRIKGLDELWNKVCEVDEKMESLKTDANQTDSYYEDDLFGTMEETYYRLKGEIQDHLDILNPQPQVNVNQNANANQNNQIGHQQNDQSKVKLPKISLPTFAGSYHTWLSFKNRFTNLIHNSKSLSNVEKLEYLKSCVTDKAEKTIQRFQITDQNYKAAWDRLNEKYDNKRILQDTQIETIIDRKEIKIESSKELRELLDVVQESLEALKNMQVDTTSWDPFMVVLVKRKLPFKTREEWEKELDPKDVPTFKQLMDFLEKRFRTVESLELVGGVTFETGNKNQSTYNKGSLNQPSISQRAKCLACNNAPHSLMICEAFLNMTLGNRNALVNAKFLCRNCLAVGHIIDECKSSRRCFKCGSSHHTLLHNEDFNQTRSLEPSYTNRNLVNRGHSNSNYNANYNSDNNPNSMISRSFVTSHQPNESAQVQQYQQPEEFRTTQNQSNQQNGTAQPRKVFTTSVQMSHQAQINPMYREESNTETLFPTAIVKIKAADGTIINLRALLDQCSEEVFIKESVAKRLGGEQVSIPAFDVTGLEGVVTSKVQKSMNLRMIIDQNDTLELEANIVENLVGMLPKTTVQWPENLFQNIKLADTNFATPNNVDIMLGSTVYAEILLGGVLKEGGYLAQNTKLGWIISGRSNSDQQPKKQSFCGFTRVMSKSKKIQNIWSEKPRKYYAPQRNSNPVYLSNRNQPILEYSNMSKRSVAHTIHSKNSKSAIVNKFHQVPKSCESVDSTVAVENVPKISNTKPSSVNAKFNEISRINDEVISENDSINHTNCLPPRLSLIDVNVNRLRKSDQISMIVNSFEQRWKSSSGLATTSMLMRPMQEMSIFSMNKPITSTPNK